MGMLQKYKSKKLTCWLCWVGKICLFLSVCGRGLREGSLSVIGYTNYVNSLEVLAQNIKNHQIDYGPVPGCMLSRNSLQEITKSEDTCYPRGVMVKAMNCGIVVREFVLQSRYYVHFRANTLGKGMNPLILPPAMGK